MVSVAFLVSLNFSAASVENFILAFAFTTIACTNLTVGRLQNLLNYECKVKHGEKNKLILTSFQTKIQKLKNLVFLQIIFTHN